jgi:hypothetical protein
MIGWGALILAAANFPFSGLPLLAGFSNRYPPTANR